MNVSHVLTAVLFIVVGYFVGSKYPGVIGKVTGGAIPV